MTRLFSYCIPIDDGAAPNPFWGLCTLVICKPAIRRTAQVGDWIVGTGSVNAPIGNASGKIVYAMRVTQKLTMRDYDEFVRSYAPNKIPRWRDKDGRCRLGDAIYDFSFDPPKVRASVHNSSNRARDLRGQYALISDHFYYFGDQPLPLPSHLLPIVNQTQGHRSSANDRYISEFSQWLESLNLKPNFLYGNPEYKLFRTPILVEDLHSNC